MPSPSPEELFEEFLRFQKDKEDVGETHRTHIDEFLQLRGHRKTSLIPTEAYNPNGTINVHKLLAKLLNPSVLLAISVAATNLYIEYAQLKETVHTRTEEIKALKEELRDTQREARKLVDSTRNRFTQNERVQASLKQAISNVQTEVRVRHGAESYQPPASPTPAREPRSRRLTQREQLRLLHQDTKSAIKRIEEQAPSSDPLLGIDF